MAMLPFIPAKPPRGRKSREASASTKPPGAPLVLQSASFDPGGPTMFLVFDRAIDISGYDGEDARFNSETLNLFCDVNGGSSLVDSVTLRVDTNQIDLAQGPGNVLTFPADNGIVAVDDGGTWSGVTDFPVTIL